MDIQFRFNHTQLSIVALQSAGIRSVKLLEESFYDPYGKLIDITNSTDSLSLFVSFGFCDSMLPILFIFETEGDTIISKQARLLTREDIKKYYCGVLHS